MINILIVDDHPDNLTALEAVLSNPEYRLVKATSGEEALRHLLHEEFAAILLDVQMPGIDGFETAMLIKKREKSEEIPILFITAIHKDELYSKKGYEIGGVDYIFKPFDPNTLRSKVAIFVNLYKKTHLLQRRTEELLANHARDQQRKLAEMELETQARFELLAEAIPQIVFTCDPDGKVDYYNHRWYEFTGLTPSESHHGDWHFFVHPRERELVSAEWQKSHLASDEFQSEYRMKGRDGTYHWFLTRASSVRNSEGKVLKWFGTSTDIEEQKRNEERLQVALDAAYMATWELNVKTGRIARSKNHHRLFGLPASPPHWSLDDFLGMIHPDDRVQVEKGIRGAVKNDDSYSAEFRTLWPDGSVHWLASRGKVLADEEGVSERISGAVIDIDILKRTEARLQEAVKAREEILAVVSHDLKNPISAIQLSASLAQRLEPGAPMQSAGKQLARIQTSADKANRLIHNLLDLAQIDAGHFHINKKEGDYRELVREEIEMLQPLAEERQVRLEAKLPARPCPISFDRERMHQVISNLVGNALKFTTPGGCVEVELGLPTASKTVKLTVRDTGVGIDPSALAHLFDRFWQVRRGDRHGTGLGLFIARGIIEAHGGRIEVQSRIGDGSTFSFELPVSDSVSLAVSA
jgi:PAS domain S-box-containing protein